LETTIFNTNDIKYRPAHSTVIYYLPSILFFALIVLANDFDDDHGISTGSRIGPCQFHRPHHSN